MASLKRLYVPWDCLTVMTRMKPTYLPAYLPTSYNVDRQNVWRCILSAQVLPKHSKDNKSQKLKPLRRISCQKETIILEIMTSAYLRLWTKEQKDKSNTILAAKFWLLGQLVEWSLSVPEISSSNPIIFTLLYKYSCLSIIIIRQTE